MAAIYMVRLQAQRHREEEDSIILRRRLRDNSDVLDMPEHLFVSNYRMTKEVFVDVLEEIAPWMKKGSRKTAIPLILRLASFLRFLAAGSYQMAVGNEHMASMTQSKVSQNISECLNIFERHICPKWIQFEMSEEEEAAEKFKFYREYGLPGVVGCVDGTHIKIMSPGNLRHLYYNHKGYYSINAMIICDFDMIVRYVDATIPGANHDAFAWKTSPADGILKEAYNSGKRNTWLLGDSGYQLLPYLMTPYRMPQRREAEIFNKKLCRARNIVERCFGVLKNRFRCIIGERALHYSPRKATKIINACCALHNMCILKKNNWQVTEEPVEESEFPVDWSAEDELPSVTAMTIRDELASVLRP